MDLNLSNVIGKVPRNPSSILVGPNGTSSLADYLKFANRYKQYLDDRRPYEDNLGLAISTLNIINDCYIDGEVGNSLYEYTEITLDEAEMLCDAIVDTIASEVDYVSFTNSVGETYRFYIDRTKQGLDRILIDSFELETRVNLFAASVTEHGRYYTYAIRSYIADLTNNFHYSVIQLFKDLVESFSINHIINECLDLIVHLNFKLETFQAKLSAWITDAAPGVKQVYNSICNAFLVSKTSGVINYLLSLIQSLSSVTVSNDALTFTDNNALIPQQFIVGIVMQTAGTLLEIAGILAASASRIIGGILIAAGAIISGIGRWVQNEYTQHTNCVLSDDIESYTLAALPIALDQIDKNYNPNSPIDMESLLESYGVFYIEVVGGLILIGPSTKAGRYRCEFHPGLTVLPSYDSGEGGIIITEEQSTYISAQGADYYAINGQLKNLSSGSLENWWKKGTHILNTELLSNPTATPLSDEDDRRIRMVGQFNTALFLSYCYLLSFGQTVSSDLIIPGCVLRVHRHSQDATILYDTPTYEANTERLQMLELMSGLGLYHWVTFGDLTVYAQYFPSYGTHPLQNWEKFTSLYAKYCKDNYWTVKFASSYDITTRDYTYIGWTSIFPLYGVDLQYRMSQNNYFGMVDPVRSDYSFGVVIPRWDKSTFILWTIASLLITAAITVIGVVTTVKFKKWLNTKTLKANAKIEAAHNDLVRNPNDDEAVKQYNKARLEANFWNNFTTGTVYSKTGYWISVDSTDTHSMAKEAFNSVTAYGADLSASNHKKTEDTLTLIRNRLG